MPHSSNPAEEEYSRIQPPLLSNEEIKVMVLTLAALRRRDRTEHIPSANSQTTVSRRHIEHTQDSDPPQEAVFKTFELLEHILIYVDALDVLIAQRVSTVFREVVRESKTLQRHLFLLADTQRPTCIVDRGDALGAFNIQLADRFILDQRAKKRTRNDPLEERTFQLVPVTLNPLLARISRGWHIGYEMPSPSRNMSESTLVSIVKPLRRVLQNDDASWRRMQLCSPPCFKARARLAFQTRMSPLATVYGTGTVEDREGVTFGALIESVLAARDGWRLGEGHVVPVAVGEEVRKMEKRDEVEASLVWDYPVPEIKLEGVVVPVDDEWEKL